MEEELGQPLFERSKWRVVLTAAGELFLPKAVHALAELDSGVALLGADAGALTGELRVGTTPTFNIHVIPRVLIDFASRHPGVRVSVEEDTSAGIARRVLTRQFDLAIAYHPGDEPWLAFEPLCNEEMVLLVAKNHPLARRRRLRVIELRRHELVLPPARFATPAARRGVRLGGRGSPGARGVGFHHGHAGHGAAVTVCHDRFETCRVSLHPDFAMVPLESPTPVRTPGPIRLRGRIATLAEASFASLVRTVTASADFPPLSRRRSA